MSVVKEKPPLGNDPSYQTIIPLKCACEDEENRCKHCKEKLHQATFDLFYDLKNSSSCDAPLENLVVPVAAAGVPNVPDGGWGWMVAFGSFIVMMLIPMLFPIFGILFSGYLLGNGTSSVTTAWIFSIQGFIWNIMGLFVGPIVEEFGWRRVGFVGITLASASLYVSAFAPSPIFLFFSLSLLSGIGGGLVTNMCFLIVPLYFKKRRGMANAIMMAGICSGEIVGPLLVRLLLDEYGFQGANLIVGAILLNGYIGISFFHPVEWHMKRTNCQKQHFRPETLNPLIIQSKDDVKSDALVTLKGNDLESNELGTLIPRKSSVAYMDPVIRSSVESVSGHHDLPSNNWSVMSASLRNSYSCVSWSGSRQDSVYEETLNSKDSSREESKSAIFVIYRLLQNAFSNLVVLKSPRAAIIATGNMLCMNCVMNFVMMVPFAMLALDHTLQDSAWCISVSAICNLLTRMVVSPLSDWSRFSMKYCYMGGYALLAMTMFVFPMLSDLKWLEVVMGIFGCGVGANMAFYNLVMIEYMGVDNLAPVYGASSLMVGVGFLVFGTVTGLVRDISGRYTASMWMLSAMAATSFFLWLLMPTAIAYDERHKERTKGDDNKAPQPSDIAGQYSKGQRLEPSA